MLVNLPGTREWIDPAAVIHVEEVREDRTRLRTVDRRTITVQMGIDQVFRELGFGPTSPSSLED